MLWLISDRRSPHTSTGLTGHLVAAVAAVAGLAMAVMPPASAGTRHAVAVSDRVSLRTVTLITGDRVQLPAAGSQQPFVLLPARGGGGAFQSYRGPAGDQIVVPTVTAPYLGRGLDPSLFDVSAQVSDGIDDGSRVPVRLSFAPGTTPAAPPGITLESVSGDSATGYLTPASGPVFTAAVRARIGADVAAGRAPGSSPLAPGLQSMTLDAPVPPVVTPHYGLHVLQINANDSTGGPVTWADAVLLNTDDMTREQTIVPVVDGVTKLAVPAGDYSVNVLFIDYDSQGNESALRVATLDDFSVPGGSGTTTKTVDESRATSKISVSTPLPATQDLMNVVWYRQDATGRVFPASLFVAGSTPMYVTPQPAARVGALRYVVQWGGVGPAAAMPGPYRYDVAFGSDQVPADEAYTVGPGDLAAVHQHFSADPAGGTQGALLSGAVDPISTASYGLFGGTQGQPMPGDLTDYVGDGDGGLWAQETVSPPGSVTSASLLADPQRFAGGQDYSVDWAHGPLAPGFGQHTGAQLCLACAAGSTLSLIFNQIGDSVPSHAGHLYADDQHLAVYRDGQQVFSDSAQGVQLTGVPATAATYRAVYDTDLPAAGFSQSTKTHTDLTMEYDPRPGPGSTLPPEDQCIGGSAGTPCAVLPVLTLGYGLASDDTNASSLTTQTMRLLVGHLSYDGAGATAPVSHVAVAVSFDGGTTWRQAAVTGSAGTYTASWPNPATARGTDPAIRVDAADADGDTITQTVWNAYAIAGPGR